LAYEEKKEFDLAIREYGEASRSIPLAHHHLGNVYFQKQDYAAAEKSYRRAIKRLPKDPNPPNNLAWMFLTLGKNLGEAQELALAAVNLAPAENKATYQDTLDQIKKAIASRPQEAAPAPKPPDPTNTIP
jgi:TolA-binding protein